MLYKNVAKHAYYQVISMQTPYIFMVLVYSMAILALNVIGMTEITTATYSSEHSNSRVQPLQHMCT